MSSEDDLMEEKEVREFAEKLARREVPDDCACIVFKPHHGITAFFVMNPKGDDTGATGLAKLARRVCQDADHEESKMMDALREIIYARRDSDLVAIATVLCVNKEDTNDSEFISVGSVSVGDDQFEEFIDTLREQFEMMLTSMRAKRAARRAAGPMLS